MRPGDESQIDRVITSHIEPSRRVVERKAQIEKRPSFHRVAFTNHFARRKEHVTEWRQMADRGVSLDGH